MRFVEDFNAPPRPPSPLLLPMRPLYQDPPSPPKRPSRLVIPSKRSSGDVSVQSPKRRRKRPGTPYPRSKRRAVVKILPLCLANLGCALDASMLAVALPALSADLGGSTVDAFWTATSFLLAAAVSQPLWSTQRTTTLAATALLLAAGLFTLGSALALMARGFALLLVARCVQGTGAGGVIALTYIIVINSFDARERVGWFGAVALVWAVGTAVGPIIGGLIVQKLDWQWIFGVNVPLGVCVVASVAIVLPVAKVGDGVAWARARQALSSLDWLGAFVFITSLTSALVSLTWGGTLYPWTSAATLGPLILGAAGLGAFALYNLRISRNPFIPKTLFVTKAANAAWLGAVAHGILLYCLLFYLPLYFVAAKGYGPIMVGLALLPYTLTIGLAAVVAGAVLSRTQTFRRCALLGWGATSLGTGLLMLLRVDTHDAVWATVSIVGGVGLGVAWPATLSAALAMAGDDDKASAASMVAFMRALGLVGGVAFGGALFLITLKNKILQHPDHAPLADAWVNNAALVVKGIGDLNTPAERDLRVFLATVFVDALRDVFKGLCVLSSVVMAAMVIWVRDVAPTLGLQTESFTAADEKVDIKTVRYPATSSRTGSVGDEKAHIKTARYPGPGDWL